MIHDSLTYGVIGAVSFFLLANPLVRSAEKDHGFIERTHKDADGKEHKYAVFVPHSYKEDTAFPCILFLHGAGEREGGSKGPADVGIGPAIKKYGEKEVPFFVVFPRCGPGRSNWSANGPDAQRALAMLDDVQKAYKIDAHRIYLTGLSLGGYGTFSLAAKYPDKWAAIVPICGGGDPKSAEKFKHIPCWCFHGDKDRAVPVVQSQRMIEALKQAGGQPKYTEYPGVDHNSWDRAYGTKELYSWLLMQSLK